MATLNRCIFQKFWLSVHQPVLKLHISVASARRTFNRFWIACFIQNFKYEDSENIKADRVSTVVFNLHQIKRRAFFLDTRYTAEAAK